MQAKPAASRAMVVKSKLHRGGAFAAFPPAGVGDTSVCTSPPSEFGALKAVSSPLLVVQNFAASATRTMSADFFGLLQQELQLLKKLYESGI